MRSSWLVPGRRIHRKPVLLSLTIATEACMFYVFVCAGGFDYGPWGNTALGAGAGLAPFLRLRAVRRNLLAVALVVGVDLYHELEYLEQHGADR